MKKKKRKKEKRPTEREPRRERMKLIAAAPTTNRSVTTPRVRSFAPSHPFVDVFLTLRGGNFSFFFYSRDILTTRRHQQSSVLFLHRRIIVIVKLTPGLSSLLVVLSYCRCRISVVEPRFNDTADFLEGRTTRVSPHLEIAT